MLSMSRNLRIQYHKVVGQFINWWQSMDQGILYGLIALFCFGILLITAASPAAAGRIGVGEYFFITKQIVYLTVAILLIAFISMLDKKSIRRLALLGFLINLCLLIIVKFYGYEIKGAKRWINLLGISIQPSELIKPFFYVLSGWILSIKFDDKNCPAISVSFILYLLVASLILVQPDIGMLSLISASWLLQIFVAGMPIILAIGIIILAGVCISIAYFCLPHVAHRINVFIAGDITNNYQVSKSLLAYESGGMHGLGPGQGVIKHSLPDSHTDFIFAVAGEEFGSLVCIVVSIIFAFIVVRTLVLISKTDDHYMVLSSVGIIAGFALQAIINIAVTLNLVPTKGMTLPFISYGGSSIIAMAINMGIIINFTKKKIDIYRYNIFKFL